MLILRQDGGHEDRKTPTKLGAKLERPFYLAESRLSTDSIPRARCYMRNFLLCKNL